MINQYRGIGLMSGTSLDGLDIAYCFFEENDGIWKYNIEATGCVDFPSGIISRLKIAPSLTSEKLKKLDIDFGRWIGEEVNRFIHEQKIKPQFTASHGYTVFHQPENGFTHQIGSGEVIHAITGIPIINNFRQLDISLGGQGAPLVPIGDQLLFSEYDVCINLGGIANISLEKNNEIKAFDVCPANMVLNFLAEKDGFKYDDKGMIARGGNFIESLYGKLEKLAYYSKPYPKSLGYEWVRDNIFSLDEFDNEKPADIANTFVMHIANRIAKDVLMKEHNSKFPSKILVTGGGSHNLFLIECIKIKLGSLVQVVIPDKQVIDYKEALIFAFLGLLKLKNIPNCLKSVTGAKIDNCGGNIIGKNPLN